MTGGQTVENRNRRHAGLDHTDDFKVCWPATEWRMNKVYTHSESVLFHRDLLRLLP